MPITPESIRAKFGGDYVASPRTFRLGIGRFFSCHLPERFRGRRVLETCTDAGFCTIALAETAERVITVEIDPEHHSQALVNVEKAGLLPQVTFVSGDILAPGVLDSCGPFDAAFLDPDWAVTGPDHVHRFRQSNMRPPADLLLARILERTSDIALILPTSIAGSEFDGLPQHERETLFLDESRELFCLYFGSLMQRSGLTEWHASAAAPRNPGLTG